MDLETDEAVGVVDRRIGLRVVQGGLAVEKNRDAGTFSSDLILVPFALLLELGNLGVGLHSIPSDAGTSSCQEFLAAGFIVERPRVTMADVSLIADHLIRRISRPEAPELDTAIHKALGSDELVFQRQTEVIEAALGRQELVTRITLHGSAHDLAVLDAPDLGISVPTRERLAVEQGRRRGKESEDSGEQAKGGDKTLHGVRS